MIDHGNVDRMHSIVTDTKHRRHRKRSNHKKQQQQSLESLVKQVQQTKGLNKDDTVDERAGLYKFTVCCCCCNWAGVLYFYILVVFCPH